MLMRFLLGILSFEDNCSFLDPENVLNLVLTAWHILMLIFVGLDQQPGQDSDEEDIDVDGDDDEDYVAEEEEVDEEEEEDVEIEPEERIETVTTTTIQPQYIFQSQVRK